MKLNIFSLSYSKLETLLVSNNFKKFYAKSIFNWLYKKFNNDFNTYSNIGKDIIKYLNEVLVVGELVLVKTLVDENDETTKFLFKTYDNHFLETVLMKFNYGYSVCVSSQIGCNMGCKFCASGLLKKIRNLTHAEIVEQFWYVNNYLFKNKNAVLSNMVVMGIGEPFDNYNNLKNALELIQHKDGLAMGSRKITVSTSGLANMIMRFANDFPQINLAISLHAPNDKIRSSIMPVNDAFNLSALIPILHQYFDFTHRRITIEYILLKGINDSDDNALELTKLLKNLNCHVNLITYNSVKENTYSKSENTKKFMDILMKNKIMTTIRLERGSQINAACGQLRAQYDR